MKTVAIKIKIQNEEHLFYFREDSLGDKGVLRQIFENHDYEISRWEQGRRLMKYHQKISQNHYSLIIDAGANIGASAMFFSKKYSNSFVFSIEPDEMNYRLLSLDSIKLNCFNFHGAISSEDGELLLIDPGHSDWGFRTEKIKSNNVINSSSLKNSLSDQDQVH